MKKELKGDDGAVGGLYALALARLKELESPLNKIIRFPRVFEKLCATFSITKRQCWEILFIFRDLGFIEIVPHHGIRILIE
jgi:hypothetical protein